MAECIQVSYSRKRGNHFKPHERIEGLGGIHGEKRWYLEEIAIIAELKKSQTSRRWNFYTIDDGKTAWVVIAKHEGREYLKTGPEDYPKNSLLELPDVLDANAGIVWRKHFME